MNLFGLKAHHVVLAALLLGLISIPPMVVAAQTGDSRTLIGGQTVAWSEPWIIDNSLTSSGDGFDLLAVGSANGLVGVGSYGFPIAGSEVRDVAIEAFAGELGLQQVDRGDYDNVSYSLDIATSDGLPLGLFTLVVESPGGTLLAILVAPVEGFQAEMESAQSSITLDGSSVFDGVDAAVMQEYLDTAVPADGGALPPNPLPTAPSAPTVVSSVPVVPTAVPAAAPTEPVAPPAVPSQDTTAGSDLVGNINEQLSGGAATEPAGGPTSQSGTTGLPPALPNSYTIPLSGNVVTYSDDWTAIESAQDTLRLANPTLGASVSVLELPDNLPQLTDARGFADSLLETPEFANTTVVEALELDDGNRWILVFSEPSAGSTLLLIYEVVGSETGSTITSISVDEQDISAAVDLTATTVQVNGNPILMDIKQQVPGIFEGAGF